MKFNSTDVKVARDMDTSDALARFRNEFYISDADMIYLDGNSLGRLPKESINLINQAVKKEWGERLIRSWNEGWIEASARIGGKLAGLIGAKPDEVIVTDATSLNLFKLAVAALKHNSARTKIVSDDLNFPSDLYVMQGIIDMLGNRHEICLASSRDGIITEAASIESLLDNNTALLTLTHTCFKSAYVHDMRWLTQSAHDRGALALWDLSHSVGSVEVDLNGCDADLAVGCTYKYLNGGPGAPAFLFVRKELQEKLRQPIRGWLGSSDPFAFDLDFTAATAKLLDELPGYTGCHDTPHISLPIAQRMHDDAERRVIQIGQILRSRQLSGFGDRWKTINQNDAVFSG